uniref:Uncharacterized protein n=1 Tax=Tanacetum cinerariifolium TaxID=118510 RepID=A0A6L2JZE4_TANCI|nr:hypothetical protein [Tanacetum cinerariifolium]
MEQLNSPCYKKGRIGFNLDLKGSLCSRFGPANMVWLSGGVSFVSEDLLITLDIHVLILRKIYMHSSMDGLDAMLEDGMLFIRNNLLILKKWNLDVNLFKEDLKEDGKSSYARVMIELWADVELKFTNVKGRKEARDDYDDWFHHHL